MAKAAEKLNVGAASLVMPLVLSVVSSLQFFGKYLLPGVVSDWVGGTPAVRAAIVVKYLNVEPEPPVAVVKRRTVVYRWSLGCFPA